MRRGISVFILVAAGFAVGTALQGRLTAQASQAAQGQDVLPALLVEVRGLRAAMEEMASAGPRVQLALGRLQLQEQRVNNLLRRLETARGSLAGAQREDENNRQQIASIEESLKVVFFLRVTHTASKRCQVAPCSAQDLSGGLDASAAAPARGVRHRAGARVRAGTLERHQSKNGGSRTGAHEEVNARLGSSGLWSRVVSGLGSLCWG